MTVGKWVKNGLLVFCAFMVSLGLLEVGVRLVSPRVLIKPLGIVPDPDLIYRLPPNAHGRYGKQAGEWLIDVKTNSRGLRDREFDYAKNPKVFRILGLGDSMTYAEGAQIEEIFYKRLEDALNKKQTPVEVINAAVRGWGPDQQVVYFEKEGYRYRPDATLIAFYSGNDYEDALHGKLFHIENGRAVHRPVSKKTSTKYRYYLHQHRIQSVPLYGWLMAHSHLVNYLRQIYPKLAIRNIYRRSTDKQVNFSRINHAEEKKAWQLVKGIYEYFFSKQHQAGRIVVILIPTYEEVLAGRSDRIDNMQQLCGIWHVPCLNLLDGLHAQKNSIDELYYPLDKHFTPTGHGWIAKQLEKALIQYGIIDGIKPNRYSDYVFDTQNDSL